MSIRAKLMSFVIRHRLKSRLSDFDDVDEIRQATSGPISKLPEDVVTDSLDAGGVPVVSYLAPESDASRVLLYFHGGGYVFGNPQSHQDLTARISRAAGLKVVSVDYRLAPEHKFPAAVDDATAAYRWLLEQGCRPDQIAVGGDSAGGGLAVALACNLKNLGIELPRAMVLISPWADLTGSGESVATNEKADAMLTPNALKRFAETYLGDANPEAPLASPVNADLTGMPPTLIQVGSTEILLSDSGTIAKKITASGGEAKLDIWPDMPHVFPLLATVVPESRRAIDDIGAFLKGELDTADVA